MTLANRLPTPLVNYVTLPQSHVLKVPGGVENLIATGLGSILSILFCDQPLKGAIFTDTDKGGVPNVSHYSGPELWRQTAQRQSVSMRLYIYKHTKYTTSSACLHKHLILALLASQQNGQELFHRVFWHCYPRRCRCFSFFFLVFLYYVCIFPIFPGRADTFPWFSVGVSNRNDC